MPTNADLKKLVDELAKELGLEIKTDSLNNEKLAELVSDLKAKKKDADTQTAADDAEAKKDAGAKAKADAENKAKADAEDKAMEAGNKAASKAGQAAYDEALAKGSEAAKPPFYVMPGKAITSKRGILATERGAKIEDYTEIKASDLSGEKDALNAFVKSGHIGKA